MDRVVVDHAVPELLTSSMLSSAHIVGQIHVVGDLADHQSRRHMHIEGESGCGAVPTQFFGRQRIRNEVPAQAAVVLGYTNTQQAGALQIFPVVVGEDSVAVRVDSPLGEIDGRSGHPGDDLAALWGQ